MLLLGINSRRSLARVFSSLAITVAARSKA
jgi:hypothetical protein